MDRQTREALGEAVLLRCKTHYDSRFDGRVYLISERALTEAVESAVEGAVFEADGPDFAQMPAVTLPGELRYGPD